ncbi:MAG: alpha/beta fold hydrolase [Bacteroidota bacterium]
MRLRFLSVALMLLVLSFTSACSEDETTVVREPTSEEVTLSIATGTVYGTLVVPGQNEPMPIVLIIAGSGPTDRDGNTNLLAGKNNSLKMLADSLLQRGYASLRYDKRGVAASQGAVTSEEALRFEDYVSDAVGWIEQLRQDGRFSEVVVLGHSEGSLIGMLAADEMKTDAYISVAGVARSADALLLEQLSTQPDFVQQEAQQIIASLRQGQTVDAVSQTLFALFRPSVQPYLISWFQYQPTEVIQRLTQPVMIVQGTTDLQVPVKEAEQLAQALPSAQLQIIDGMNHVLKTAPAESSANIATYTNPDLPLAPGLTDGITSFIDIQLQ